MTQEDKAKAYDEAIERAEKQLDGAKVFDYDNEQIAHDIRTTVYNIFPELKEPEDEEVRKAMIDFFKNEREEGIAVLHYGVNIERMIAWLEKQGEQKPAWSEEDEKRLKSCLNVLQAKGIMGVTDTINTKWLKSLKERYTWKPSDVQLDALQYVYRNCNPLPSDKSGWDSIKTIESMYHDLKKLREE